VKVWPVERRIKKRCYTKLDAGRFIAEIKALICSKISLSDNDKPPKLAKTTTTADDKPAKKETANKGKADKATGAKSLKESSPKPEPDSTL